MTREEVSRQYNIPIKILDEYQGWSLCGSAQMAVEDRQYRDQDLKRLSMIMSLHDMGFASDEVETYMRLLMKGAGTQDQRMKMLEKHRSEVLNEIHLKERQIDHIDYFRYEIRKNMKQSS